MPGKFQVVGGSILAATLDGMRVAAKAMQALRESPDYTVYGPPVSVIIPTLQEEDWIEPLLTSIRNQSYQPIEIIISDSSPPESKRATRQIGELYGARMVDSPQLNVAAGRNAGARAATGEILIFCDADCILSQDFTERLVALLDQDTVLAHGNDCVYDNIAHNTLHTFWRYVKPSDFTTGRGVAMRAGDFFLIGGYDEECDPMQGCREDLDLGRRVLHTFGPGSIRIDRNALVATSARRPLAFGRDVWQKRGYRNGIVEKRPGIDNPKDR